MKKYSEMLNEVGARLIERQREKTEREEREREREREGLPEPNLRHAIHYFLFEGSNKYRAVPTTASSEEVRDRTVSSDLQKKNVEIWHHLVLKRGKEKSS